MFNPYVLFILSVIWYMAVRNGVNPDSLDRDAYTRFAVLSGPVGWFFAAVRAIRNLIIYGPSLGDPDEIDDTHSPISRPVPRRRIPKKRSRKSPDEKFRI